MAQHDYDIANDTAANVRADINDVLAAIVSNNSGASAPATTYANQWWYDSTNNILKIRNEVDTAWIDFATVNQTDSRTEFATLYAGNISDGTDTVGAGYVVNGSAKAWVNFNGTGTIAIRDSLNVSSLTDNGVGDYTVTLTNAMANTDYANPLSAARDCLNNDAIRARTASEASYSLFSTSTGAGLDGVSVNVSYLGDLA